MGELHILFLPVMAHGHMIPVLDMAKLFSSHGVKTTILVTSAFSEPVKRAQEPGLDIGMRTLMFPPEGSSLPKTVVSIDQVTSPDLVPKFVQALSMLQEEVEQLLQEEKPHCLVSDMFLPWTTDSAANFGIPRLVFHGTSFFAICGNEHMRRYRPFQNVSSDSEPFLVPDLPHQLWFTRTQVADFERDEFSQDDFGKLIKWMREVEPRNYGAVVNSFYELEPEYAEHYRKVLGRKAWHIGPLSLCNKRDEDKARRGKKSAIDEHECLAWLDSKKENTVVYVCFGSMANFTDAQLRETALGLEASGIDFIWVVRKGKEENEDEDWLLKGFEERMKGKGLIIRGWAPQVLILDHPVIGAFVTHCGWNSTLEGVCAGLPMVTWPVFAEQFFNEKLVTEVLKIGVSVGNKYWKRVASEGVSRETVTNAVQRVMVGEEAEGMRKRAKEYKEMARKAVEEGGSSYNDLKALIDELCKLSSVSKE